MNTHMEARFTREHIYSEPEKGQFSVLEAPVGTPSLDPTIPIGIALGFLFLIVFGLGTISRKLTTIIKLLEK